MIDSDPNRASECRIPTTEPGTAVPPVLLLRLGLCMEANVFRMFAYSHLAGPFRQRRAEDRDFFKRHILNVVLGVGPLDLHQVFPGPAFQCHVPGIARCG